jgi:chromate transport protein ChrA
MKTKMNNLVGYWFYRLRGSTLYIVAFCLVVFLLFVCLFWFLIIYSIIQVIINLITKNEGFPVWRFIWKMLDKSMHKEELDIEIIRTYGNESGRGIININHLSYNEYIEYNMHKKQ